MSSSFQGRVLQWMHQTFGRDVIYNKNERAFRFLEEALELVQAQGMTARDVQQVAAYVYGRDVGRPKQEVGGVMVTLAALCSVAGYDMQELGDVELARCWTKIEEIKAKQAGKPKAVRGAA